MALLCGIAAVLVFPPHGAGWAFFLSSALLALLLAGYALAVGRLAARMKFAAANNILTYVEYFKPHQVFAEMVGALQLSQRRGQYGPGPLEGHVLGPDGRPVLPEIAAGAFDPIDILTLFASIRKPIRGEPGLVIDNWLRPALNRRLGDIQWDRPIEQGDVSRLLTELKIGTASGRLEIRCEGRTVAIDFINGRALRSPRWNDSYRQCARGNARFRAFQLDAQALNAIPKSLDNPLYYIAL